MKKSIWNIPPRTHNNLVSNVTDNINTTIKARMVCFIFKSRNYSNGTCKNVLRVKLHLSTLSLLLINNVLTVKFGLISLYHELAILE